MALTTKSWSFVPYAPMARVVVRGSGDDAGIGRSEIQSPARRDHARSSEAGAAPQSQDDVVMVPGATMQTNADVLLVDDDGDVRWTVAEILRSAGFSVAEAEDGDVALDLLSNGRYRMVLLDMRMPKRDGISVIEEAGDVPPVIVHSAYTLNASDRERLGTKVVDYLHKPVSPQKLLRAVETVLGPTK
jgi:two-component system chemotaxis response regulator CheY